MEHEMPLIDFKDLKARKGIPFSDTTLWRMVRDGRFPRPTKIGRRNCWDEVEIDQYIEDQLAQRDKVEG
jgi:predicted DNA-binding transcriptional regulator AlpA